MENLKNIKKRILVLGCTGSIGTQTLDIARNMREKFEICGLSANKKKEELHNLCKEFNCKGTLFTEDGFEGIESIIKSTNAGIATKTKYLP